ncbi:hypothetical protein KIL84_010375 [Mauremys mutica]|uniref:Uncharacterized protein n=1 Tax=Mauremys mutica TaxID=74926 RepID=A0A9D3XBI9_9SAUR|nr:hypothetical protein KIL84_010375 [Mauremys mutica]
MTSLQQIPKSHDRQLFLLPKSTVSLTGQSIMPSLSLSKITKGDILSQTSCDVSDMQRYVSLSSNTDGTLSQLSQFMKGTEAWMKDNLNKITPGKTKVNAKRKIEML